MRAIPEAVLQAALGAMGLLFGVLSVIALAFAALIPALLGMLAFLLSPLRALAERGRS